ncbi:MAG: hypothetical protein U9Q82_02325, partial [Chloroflexota bacterium]|nr:hypothetical protein [Chloroflexota bacterium]
KQDSIGVGHAMLPNGQRIAVLKTLLTSVCESNCYYCPFRSGRDFRRASFTPDEFAQVLYTCTGLGLSKGFS